MWQSFLFTLRLFGTQTEEGSLGEIHTRGQAWIECVVAADLRLRNRATGLDLSKTLAKMEVASALLEASKKLSGSADSSTSSSCSATWSSSINEVGCPPALDKRFTIVKNILIKKTQRRTPFHRSVWLSCWTVSRRLGIELKKYQSFNCLLPLAI